MSKAPKPQQEPETIKQEPEKHKPKLRKPESVKTKVEHPLSKPETVVLQKPKPEAKEFEAEVKPEPKPTVKKKGIECLCPRLFNNNFHCRVRL